jgi:hypothetical protein
MSYQNPITLELLMQERLCDRLHEAQQERIAHAARRAARGARRPLLAVTTATVAFLGMLSSLI